VVWGDQPTRLRLTFRVLQRHGDYRRPGYYAVTLDDYKIRAEATAAPHSGMLRFTFSENPQSRIQIDLARRVGGTSLRQGG